MKGQALATSPLALVLALTSACASTSRPESMPDWKPSEVELVAAAAPRYDDHPQELSDDSVRIPRAEEERETWPARGLYIGGAIITSQPMGDFDGDSAYARTTSLVLIPDLDVGAGGGVYVSYRWHMNELMLQYSITEHDGDFSGSTEEHDTTFYDLDFNWRHYFWEKSFVQPYGLLGLGWGRAEIDNGSTDIATQTIFEDADLEDGINVNVGAGVAMYTLPWVSFFAQAMYKFSRYKSIDGIDGDASATPDVDSDSWNIQFGAAIRLLPPRHD
jgi:outer membrane protein with beta-barrel domain